ncbi:SH3 domain-containing protein [Duganella sp. Root1480D1]|uniref:SH3 domain-containing protein n=1 Tax=Duganella sp. Root1480D1 TaxID=1736471 RepID=UPI000709152A|nr:SH3 domain-containing protein [Duganella sp. Root1480D1]KQZ42394.1 hypothetical protein ASD58_23720 [Duganella sp. Root1480D1]
MNRSLFATSILATACLTNFPASAAEAAAPTPQCAVQPENPDPAFAYVIASSAAVRAAPSATAELIAYAPIATRLNVLCQQESWLKVDVLASSGFQGWMRANLQGRDMPTIEAALAALHAIGPGNLPALRTQGERVIALDPVAERNYETVLQALRQAGDAETVHKLEARLAALRSPTVAQGSDEPKVIFIADNGNMRPLARLEGSKLFSFPSIGGTGLEYSKDYLSYVARYFAAGRAYHFYTRGGVDGMALAQRFSDELEQPMATIKRVAAKAPGANGLMANFKLTEKQPDGELAASAGQQKAALELARNVLKAKGVQPADIPRILEAEHVAISAVPGQDGAAPVLVLTANLAIPPEKQQQDMLVFRIYTLLLVMEANSQGKYEVAHQVFRKASGESEETTLDFLTYADVNQDGKPELVLREGFYESNGYWILGRQGKAWKELVEANRGK